MSAGEFPNDKVWIYKDCLPEEATAWIRELAGIYAKAPNFWMPKELLEGNGQDQILTPAESVIWHLYHRVAKHQIPQDCSGAEWWVQVYDGGSGLAFHFDKDEHVFKTEGIMMHPSYSSVLYLTGTDEDRLRQASTVILDQRFDSRSGTTNPESPSSCVFVLPSMGKYCMFDGSLGHGVLDSSNPERRATMLINWWKNKPQAVNRPTVQDLEQLSRAATMHSTNPPPSLFSSQSAMHQQTLSPAGHNTYPVIRVPSEDEDVKESGILVDDLLDAYLLDAFGVNSVQAVGVSYAGHVLYPIDPSKTKQDISKKLIIPAAFIPEEVQVGP